MASKILDSHQHCCCYYSQGPPTTGRRHAQAVVRPERTFFILFICIHSARKQVHTNYKNATCSCATTCCAKPLHLLRNTRPGNIQLFTLLALDEQQLHYLK